jgi:hypothetical protein
MLKTLKFDLVYSLEVLYAKKLYNYHYLYDKNVMLTTPEGENNHDAKEPKVTAY